jgi:hypothetical protein
MDLVELLRKQVNEKHYVDVGVNSAKSIGVGRTKLGSALNKLREEGYQIFYIKLSRPGSNLHTMVKVLTRPGVTFREAYQNRGQVVKLEGEM